MSIWPEVIPHVIRVVGEAVTWTFFGTKYSPRIIPDCVRLSSLQPAMIVLFYPEKDVATRCVSTGALAFLGGIF